MRTMDFNSRPHGGRLKKADFEKLLNISTHALTEGDRITALSSPSTMIFQLTPSRRATTHTCTGATPAKDFNSRPHGGRRAAASLCRTSREISTHALTEGDHHSARAAPLPFHFNSRPHGGRPYFAWMSASCELFQLTPSRRATDTPVITEHR